MLHIVTPLYRFENLESIHRSIPKHVDIRWHLAKSNKREDIKYCFNDDRVLVYNVDCEDDDTTSKRNAVFKNIGDGYFCLLDDDTVFHNNMYILYKRCMNDGFKGMVIGQQLFKDGSLRLKEMLMPQQNQIDSGNVLCHSSCLRHVKWPEKLTWPRDPVNGKGGDGDFWLQCWSWFAAFSLINAGHDHLQSDAWKVALKLPGHQRKFRTADGPISYYNALREDTNVAINN